MINRLLINLKWNSNNNNYINYNYEMIRLEYWILNLEVEILSEYDVKREVKESQSSLISA